MNEIATDGGYVWSQYRGVPKAKLGYVPPGSKIELVESVWERYPKKLGRKAILKTLQLRKVRNVAVHELMNLRACRPRQGTISTWKAAADRVRRYVDRVSAPFSWPDLSPAQQEVACVEYLRESPPEGVRRLGRLLLPPGRTLADVDIYATAASGSKKIFVQVTYYRASASSAQDKLARLRAYGHGGDDLYFFCRCDSVTESDGVVLIPIGLVEGWLKNRTNYLKQLLQE